MNISISAKSARERNLNIVSLKIMFVSHFQLPIGLLVFSEAHYVEYCGRYIITAMCLVTTCVAKTK